MGELTYWISYPSGAQQILRGRPYFMGDQHCPVIVLPGEADPIYVIDPRAVIRAEGRVVYTPREHLRCVPRWVRGWLREHPEWGRAA